LNLRNPLAATVDPEGRLVMQPEVASHLGLRPGTSVTLDQEQNSYRMRRPVEQLARVCVEPAAIRVR